MICTGCQENGLPQYETSTILAGREIPKVQSILSHGAAISCLESRQPRRRWTVRTGAGGQKTPGGSRDTETPPGGNKADGKPDSTEHWEIREHLLWQSKVSHELIIAT